MAPPDDIFEKVDPTKETSVSKVGRPVPAQPVPAAPVQYTAARRWPILAGAGVVLVLGAGVVAFFLMRKSAATPITNITPTQKNVNAEATTTNTTPAQTLQNITAAPDKDADGLTDDREQELGTSLTKADTDGDGLADAEEVNIYITDPKRPDTDGDGNLDGAEVKKGYNPKGPGLLLDLEAAKQKLQK